MDRTRLKTSRRDDKWSLAHCGRVVRRGGFQCVVDQGLNVKEPMRSVHLSLLNALTTEKIEDEENTIVGGADKMHPILFSGLFSMQSTSRQVDMRNICGSCTQCLLVDWLD